MDALDGAVRFLAVDDPTRFQRHIRGADITFLGDVLELSSGLKIVGDIRLVGRGVLSNRLGLISGNSDRHLVAAAWARWGTACVQHLQGSFAFLLWDTRTRTLFGARDPLGIKPLFYDLAGSRFIAASRLDQLLWAHPQPPPADDRSVAGYLSRPHFMEPRGCLRQRITALQPGHSLTLSPKGLQISRYCRLPDVPRVRFARAEEYDDALLSQLKQAVADCVNPDESVGFHLTGGLDSSSIGALAAPHCGRRPYAFSWLPAAAPDVAEPKDQQLIRLMAERTGALLEYCPLQESDLLSCLLLDPLNCSVTSTLQLEACVQRAASKAGVTVLLSGWGGDQALTIHGNHPHWLKTLVRFCHPASTPAQKVTTHYLKQPSRYRPMPKDPLAFNLRTVQWHKLQHASLAERMQSWDWSGADHGIEYRYPMLDIRLIRLLLGMPSEVFTPGRGLARRILTQVLPEPVIRYTDKSDSTRSAANRLVHASTMRQLLPLLDHCDPERGEQIDLSRLRADMQCIENRADAPVGLMLRTLAFLKLPL